jgi:hypothetical protein
MLSNLKYSYDTLPRDNGDDIPPRPVPARRRLRRATTLAVIFAFAIFFSLLAVSRRVLSNNSKSIEGLTFLNRAVVSSHPSNCDGLNGFICKPKISHWLGQYSPYYSVPSEIGTNVPDQCTITFAQALSRHGARDPTASKSIAYGAFIAGLKSRVKKFHGIYTFLNDYQYTLGTDQLTVLGEQQMVNAGIKFYERYKELAQHALPFVRTAGQERVVNSARNWTQGFHQALVDDKRPGNVVYPYNIEIIPEGKDSNNTLSIDTCTAFSSNRGENAQYKWLNIFVLPILDRLNSDIPEANLQDFDVIYLMDLCPFHIVASPSGKISPFCNIFTDTEWQHYDYYQSLGKWYGYGPGNALGPSKGVGWVNELIARLTNTGVDDSTSTNRTLDENPKTFPIDKKHTLFSDFSHDNDMMNIFAALGIYNATKPLSNITFESPETTKGFSASWVVPFGARAYFEKLSCKGEKEELVRVIINDRVAKLETCGGDKNGLCKLSKFVESLSFARAGGFWDKCFEMM